MGNLGATVGFSGLAQAKIAPLRIKIEGAPNGSYKWPNNWYAYGFNRTPSGPQANSSYIYTRERGKMVGFDFGAKIVIRNGKVVAITGASP